MCHWEEKNLWCCKVGYNPRLPTQPLLICTRKEGLPTAGQGWELRLPNRPCMGGGRVYIIVVFFMRCLTATEWFLSKSFVSCLVAPFLVLWLEWGGFFFCGFWFVCFLSVLISIFIILASPDHSPGYMMTAQSQGNSLLCTWVSRSLANLPSSLHLSESSYFCFIHNVHCFFAVFVRRNRKKYTFLLYLWTSLDILHHIPLNWGTVIYSGFYRTFRWFKFFWHYK